MWETSWDQCGVYSSSEPGTRHPWKFWASRDFDDIIYGSSKALEEERGRE